MHTCVRDLDNRTVIVLYPALLIAAIVIVIRRDRESGHGWLWFLGWSFAGASFFFSFLTGLSIGLLLLPLVTAAVLFVAMRSPHAPEASGFFAGVGLVTVAVSLLSWGEEHLSASSWLAAGAAITGVAIASYALTVRRSL
jgi:uncharacterized membrane protein